MEFHGADLDVERLVGVVEPIKPTLHAPEHVGGRLAEPVTVNAAVDGEGLPA